MKTHLEITSDHTAIPLAAITDSNGERLTLSWHPGSKSVIASNGERIELHDSITDIDAAYVAICAMYNNSIWDFEDLYAYRYP